LLGIAAKAASSHPETRTGHNSRIGKLGRPQTGTLWARPWRHKLVLVRTDNSPAPAENHINL